MQRESVHNWVRPIVLRLLLNLLGPGEKSPSVPCRGKGQTFLGYLLHPLIYPFMNPDTEIVSLCSPSLSLSLKNQTLIEYNNLPRVFPPADRPKVQIQVFGLSRQYVKLASTSLFSSKNFSP